MDQKFNNIYAYIRVSVAKYKKNDDDKAVREEEENRLSIQEQKQKAIDYAKKIGREITEFFVDYGKSGGRKKKREQLSKLLETVEASDLVLVADISRLSRSVIDFNILLELAKQKQYVYYFITNDIWSNTSNGQMMLNILSIVSETERTLASNRVKRTWEYRKKKKEEEQKNNPPLTLNTKYSEKCWISRPEYKKTADLIVKKLKEGCSYNKIASELNEFDKKTINDKKFYASTISELIPHLPMVSHLCECGAFYPDKWKMKHNKTQKHKAWIQEQRKMEQQRQQDVKEKEEREKLRNQLNL